MLLGYNSWSMPTLDIDRTVKHLAGLGYDSMELTICPGWPTEAMALDTTERRRIKALIADHGLRLSGCTGNTPVLVDEHAWPANRTRLEAYLDFVAEMQGPGPRLYLATTSGLPEGANPASAWEPSRNVLVDRFGQLAECAAARHVTMHLEPHVHTAVRRADQVLWLLDRINSPALRISLDISHFEVQGIDFREVVPLLAPVTGAVEVKDERGVDPEFTFLVPGEGDMDYAGFLGALAQAGFDGSVSVEVSKMRQAIEGYDPLAAATISYDILARAFVTAGVQRGK
jgi:sugar phosphate isomerase/epimerase